MPESATIERTRGEDGRFASAQPPTPDASAATPAATVPTPAPAAAALAPESTVAVPATPGLSPYEAARKAIDAKYANEATVPAVATDTEQVPAHVSPPTPTGTDNRHAPTTPSPSPTPSESTDEAAAVKAYTGQLSQQEFRLLKSVPGMLPDPSAWQGMSPTERMEHIQDVRHLRNERNRQFQQQRQAPATPATAQPTTPESGLPQQARGTRGSGEVPAAPAAAAPLPAEVEADLAKLAEEWGDHPLVRTARTLAVRNAEMAQRLEQQDQHRQTEAQRLAVDRQARQIEDGVFEQIKDAYPDVKDPAVRDEIRQAARDLFAIRRQRQGFDPDPAEVIRFAAHNTLYPRVQQRQQQEQAAQRQRSLTGTFDRGVPAPLAPTTARPQGDDVYAVGKQRLNAAYAQGLSGEAARKFAYAGAR